MKYIKMFISGMALPSFIIPFLVIAALNYGKSQIIGQPFLHFIPLIWGVWNILYFLIFTKILPGNTTIRILLTGGILGLLIAIYGVFWLHIPSILGLPESMKYLPLLIAPIIYSILWLIIVKPLNDLLGLSEV